MTPRLVFKAALVCCLLLLGTEAALGLAKRHPAFFKLFDNQIPSPEVLNDMLAARAHGTTPLVLVFGDSVVYGSGLHAHGVRAWRENTIAAYLQQRLPQCTVVDLSLDGALPGDYLSLYQTVRRLKPAWVVFEFNYRMFSQKYQTGAEAISRPWLARSLALPLFSQPPATAGEKISAFLCRHSLLYRYAEAYRNAVFFPSREEVFNRLLSAVLPAASLQDPEEKELLLKLKLKPYYYSPVMTDAHASLQAGRLLLAQLRADQQPGLIFFTPQNLEFIADIADQAAFAQNLGILDRLLGAGGAPDKLIYYDWFRLYGADAFYDHCHLLPRYNADLAQKLADAILHAPGGRHVQPLE